MTPAPVDLARFFDPAELAAWARYRQIHRVFYFGDMAIMVAFLAAFLVLTPRLRAGCERLAARLSASRAAASAAARLPALARVPRLLYGDASWLSAALFAAAFFVARRLVFLPTDVWEDLYWERKYGLATYTVGRYFRDYAVGVTVSALGFAFIVIGLFGLIRRMPRRFWLALGVPCAILLAASGFLDPWRPYLFYAHHDLAPGAVRARLETLAAGAGVPLSDIVVLKTSEVSKAADASLAGLGSVKRMFLSDTLLAKFPEDEIGVAVAHELGHASQPRWLRPILAGAAAIALLFALSLLLRAAARRRFLDIAHPGDATSVALVWAFAFLFFNAAGPIQNAVGRADESMADAVALDLTRDPGAFERLFVRVAKMNRAEVAPSAAVRFWMFDHPPVAERLAMAEAWRAEHPAATAPPAAPAPARPSAPGPPRP